MRNVFLLTIACYVLQNSGKKDYSYRHEQKVSISEQLEDMILTLQLLRGKEQSYVLHSFNAKVKAKESLLQYFLFAFIICTLMQVCGHAMVA